MQVQEIKNTYKVFYRLTYVFLIIAVICLWTGWHVFVQKIFIVLFLCIHLINVIQFPKVIRKAVLTTLDLFLVIISAISCIAYIASVLCVTV